MSTSVPTSTRSATASEITSAQRLLVTFMAPRLLAKVGKRQPVRQTNVVLSRGCGLVIGFGLASARLKGRFLSPGCGQVRDGA